MSGNIHIGSFFSDFLKEEGIYDEVIASAINGVKAREIDQNPEVSSDAKVGIAAHLDSPRRPAKRIFHLFGSD